MKNGQITLFIIVGIVILSIFVFLFTITASVSEDKLERQRERAVSSALDAALIQRYASVCADNALETGLKLIGLQGGSLFAWQLGGVVTPDHISFMGNDVGFGIMTRLRSPLYPCSEQFAAMAPAFCRYPYTNSVIKFGQSRLPLLEGGPLSVQKQLEQYIAAYVRRCVDVNRLQEEEGLQAYAIQEGMPAAEVIFRNADVVAKIDYPLSVSIGGEEPVTQFVYFESQLPVRFRHIYNTMSEIIQKDISDLGYDVRTEAMQELPFSPAFPNPLKFRYESAGHHELFIVEDPFSVVGSQNYIFQSARQNRPPALDYIYKYESLHDLYDYLLVVGDVAQFEAHAEDPDEDAVSYEFKSDFGIGVGNRFSTAVPDAGYYSVVMSATDGSLGDWQDVRILADPQLHSDFVIDNGYADVPDNFLSIEDPFFLDASAAKKTLDPYATYSFTYSFFSAVPQTTSEVCSIVPGYGHCEPGFYDFGSISIDNLNNGISLGAQEITLLTRLAYNGFEQSDSANQQIEVTECLPHRNPGTAPYPYNNEDVSSLYPNNPELNPFQADHMCCTNDFTIAGQDTACYTLEQCGHPAKTLLSRRSRYCSGDSGNTCEGDWSADWDNLNRCGFNGRNECSEIADGCQGYIPYITREGLGWCNGPTGCEQLGCGRVPIIGALFGFEIGGIDSDSSGLNSPQDYCGCTEADVDNQRACIKDGSVTGVCSELFGLNYCA